MAKKGTLCSRIAVPSKHSHAVQYDNMTLAVTWLVESSFSTEGGEGGRGARRGIQAGFTVTVTEKCIYSFMKAWWEKQNNLSGQEKIWVSFFLVLHANNS